MSEETPRRLAVLAHAVAPWVSRLEEPANIVERVRAGMVLELMQPELRRRREVAGDAAFMQFMLDEIAARIVAVEAMLAEHRKPEAAA